MKKVMVLLLTIVFIGSFSLTVLGQTGDLTEEEMSQYYQKALDYLTNKYQVDKEEVILAPGMVEELKHIGKTFWWSKFDVNNEYNGIYIDIASEKIYLKEEVDSLFEEDRELADKKYETLKEEAGKIELSLYEKLAIADNDKLFFVSIVPAYVPNQEIIKQIDQLKEDYTDVFKYADENGNILKGKVDDGFNRDRISEYRRNLNEIKRNGYQQTQEELIQYFNNHDIVHEASDGYMHPWVTTKLSKQQIEELANKNFVSLIREEGIMDITDEGPTVVGEDIQVKDGEAKITTVGDSDTIKEENQAKESNYSILLMIGAVLAISLLIYTISRKRK